MRYVPPGSKKTPGPVIKVKGISGHSEFIIYMDYYGLILLSNLY